MEASLTTLQGLPEGIAVANPECPLHKYPPCPLPSYILKSPFIKKPKTKAPKAVPESPPATHRAVSLEFLRYWLRRLPGGAHSGATVSSVVDEIIKPATGPTQCSYAASTALVPPDHTSTPTFVVIHPWDMPLSDLVAALGQHCAGLPPAATYFWLAALATSQHLPRPSTVPVMPTLRGSGGPEAVAAAVEAARAAAAAAVAAAVRARREELVAETRAAIGAARCGALLVMGREARPLRRGWAVFEAAEMVRQHGPEALTVLPLEKDFGRAALAAQLRELSVTEAIASGDAHDVVVLAAAMGVPAPQHMSRRRLLAAGASRRASRKAAPDPEAGAGGASTSAETGDGSGGVEAESGEALAVARQLQLALLLRPMDGAQPARALGACFPASVTPSLRPASAPVTGSPERPWAFFWLWDWSPFNAWVALPPEHPSHRALLITGRRGEGKTTAMAALLATHGPGISACHFCSAADSRSMAPGEMVRGLAFQLACQLPEYGAALWRAVQDRTGSAGGGVAAAACPDTWVDGMEEAVNALLRAPLEQIAYDREQGGLQPMDPVLLLVDGLEEGIAGQAAVAAAGQHAVLRLLLDHLHHLPGVRLVLSCTADDSMSGPSSGVTNMSGPAATQQPSATPPAPVHAALRWALAPAEVPLGCLRRGEYLPLALAHAVQEYVLSPELTGRELLWQARGSLAHAHLLQLLVEHAAEGLQPGQADESGAAGGGVEGGPDGSGGRRGTDAGGSSKEGSRSGTADGSDAGAGKELVKEAVKQPAIRGVTGSGSGGAKGEEALARPRTPPLQPGPQRPPSSLSEVEGASGKEEREAEGRATEGGDEGGPSTHHVDAGHDKSGNGMGSAADAPQALQTASQPDVTFGPCGSGGGTAAAHVIPPVSRGSLLDEYDVLWRVRTAGLVAAAILAAGLDEREPEAAPELAAARPGGSPDKYALTPRDQQLTPRDLLLTPRAPLATPRGLLGTPRVSEVNPRGPQLTPRGTDDGNAPGSPRNPSRSMSQAKKPSVELSTLPPAVDPGGAESDPRVRLTRLQLVVDVLSAAREPLEWTLLARLVQRVGGGGAGNGPQASIRGSVAPTPRVSLMGGPRPSTEGAAAATGGASSRHITSFNPASLALVPEHAEEGSEERKGSGDGEAVSEDDEEAAEAALLATLLPGADLTAAAAEPAVAAVRDLEWALQEGPLAGLLWQGGDGRLRLRHSSFADWMRGCGSEPSPQAQAAVAAAGPGCALVPPRPAVGHALLAHALRQQLQAAAAREAAVAGMPVSAVAPGLGVSGFGGASMASRAAATPPSGASRAPSRASQAAGMGLAGGGGVHAPGAVAAGPLSGYCRRHLVAHCLGSRAPAPELEAVLTDLILWRHVFEAGDLAAVVHTIERALRPRGAAGPRERSPQRALPPPSLTALPLTPLPLATLPLPPLPLPLTPLTHTVAGTATAAASAASGRVRSTSLGSLSFRNSMSTTCTSLYGMSDLPRRLPSSAVALLRDTLCWLRASAAELSRRPDPVTLACSAAAAPALTPLRRRAEQLTAATTAAIAAAAAVATATATAPGSRAGSRTGTPFTSTAAAMAASLLTSGTPRSSFALHGPATTASFTAASRAASRAANPLPPTANNTAAAGNASMGRAPGPSAPSSSRFLGASATLSTSGAANEAAGSLMPEAPAEPPWPPAAVTGLPQASYWSAELPRAACGHRVTRLLPSRDGEALLAGADWTLQATLLDMHTCRPGVRLAAPRDAHGAALSCPAWSPGGSWLATAGEAAGAITLWDAATGAPRCHLDLTRALAVGTAQAGDRGGEGLSAGNGEGARRALAGRGAASVAGGLAGAAEVEAAVVSCIRVVSPAPGAGVLPCSCGGGGCCSCGGGDGNEGPACLLLAAGSRGCGRVALWEVAHDGGGARLAAVLALPSEAGGGGSHGVAWLEFSPCGRQLAVVQGCSTAVHVWGVQARHITATLRLQPGCGEVLAVHWSPHAGDASPAAARNPAMAPNPAVSSAASSPRAPMAPRSLPARASATAAISAVATPRSPAAASPRPVAAVTPQAAAVGSPRTPTVSTVRASVASSLRASLGSALRASAAGSSDGGAGAGGAGEALLAIVCTNCTQLWSVPRRQRLANIPLGAGDAGAAWAEQCVAFSPAGGLLAAAGALDERAAAAAAAFDDPGAASVAAKALGGGTHDCDATLYDGRTGAQVAQLHGLGGRLHALAFSPDGQLLAAAAGGSVSLWSASAAVRLAVLMAGGEAAEAQAVAFGRGGTVLVAAVDSAVHAWDVPAALAAAVASAAANGSSDGSSLGSVGGPSRLGTPGGMAHASAGGRAPGASGLVALARGGHSERVNAACWSPSGSLLLTGGYDNTVRVWEARRLAEVGVIELAAGVCGLAWSPDGAWVAVAQSNGVAAVWHAAPIAAAAAAAASPLPGGPPGPGRAELSPREAAHLALSDGSVGARAVAFSARGWGGGGGGEKNGGGLLVTLDGAGGVALWAADRGWARLAAVGSEALSTRGSGLVPAGGAGGGGVVLSADGAWVLLGCGKEVAMWSVSEGREAGGRLGPHGGAVAALAASGCGRNVAVAAGGCVSVWGRAEGAGAVGSGDTVAVANAPTDGEGGGGDGEEPGDAPPSLPAPFQPRRASLYCASDVACLAFSADGGLLAAGCTDGRVCVWESGRWRQVGWLAGHQGAAACLVFSPDGKALVSTGWDARCLVWAVRDALAK